MQIIIGVIILIVLTLSIAWRKELIAVNPFRNKRLLDVGSNYPVIWLYYDTSQVNARNWSDFMGRSSRVINEPFLNLCYKTIVEKNAGTYRVEVINGLADLAARLGGWEQLPEPLRTPIADVGEKELNWIRAAVLARWGGLWLHPAVICVRGFGPLDSGSLVAFGSDPWEERGDSEEVPSMRAIWAGSAGRKELVSWEMAARERVERRSSNSELRRDDVWDWKRFCGETGRVEAGPELNRKRDGRRIEIEDLLMAGQEGNYPFNISRDTVYVPIPWKDIQRRSAYGWFLRMSEEQIMESDIAVRYLFEA